jgi:predicted DCC family thiol-disulfide oxidoreductase YuxK
VHNGWTGGQYSLYRILFGSCLIGGFLASVGPGALTIFVVAAGTACCIAFTLGWHDRRAAVLIFVLGVVSSVLEPHALDAGRIFAGWLLFVHVMLPPAPYGSLSAVGRDDPRGGWYVSRPVHLGTWALMGLWYSFTGFSMLIHPGWLRGGAIDGYVYYRAAQFTPWSGAPLSTWEPTAVAWLTWSVFAAHLAFAPLALFWRLRPWLWATFAALHLAALIVFGDYEFSLALLLLHAFTFDPAWIRPRGSLATETVFFDGTCGLCNGAIRFLMAEDTYRRFDYVPLDSDLFLSSIPEEVRRGLPDSVVVRTEDGRLLVRSAAVLHTAARLGGLWRLLGAVGAWVPRPVRDAVYDFVSEHRRGIRP